MEKSSEALDPKEFVEYCLYFDWSQEYDLDLPPEKRAAYDELRQFLEDAFDRKDPPPKIVLGASTAFGVDAKFFQDALRDEKIAKSISFGSLFGDCTYLADAIRGGLLFGPPSARDSGWAETVAKAMSEAGSLNGDAGTVDVFAAWFGK